MIDEKIVKDIVKHIKNGGSFEELSTKEWERESFYRCFKKYILSRKANLKFKKVKKN